MRCLSKLSPDTIKNKSIIIRCDLNMPLKNGIVTDSRRLDTILPTLYYLQKCKAKILLISHLGRPKVQRSDALSFKQFIPFLEEKIGVPIEFLKEIKHPSSSLALLENIRFWPEEEKNDPIFAKKLASLGDLFVNEAFSASHRAHASIAAIQNYLPSYAGFTVEKEIKVLTSLLQNPKHPCLALIGGSKISTKITLIENLIPKLDHLILGGAMANNFLAVNGKAIGSSMVEKEHFPTAEEILKLAKKYHCQIHLPIDAQIATSPKTNTKTNIVDISSIPKNQMILDIGPKTIQAYKNLISNIKTLLWNGPLGVFELPPFDKGTNTIAQHVASLCKKNILTAIAGGGDTAAALKHAAVDKDFTYLSNAGGAFLEWLEGKRLPGIAPLLDDKAI